MALTLVAEDGSGVDGANTYCSREDADTYLDGRLYAEKWQTVDAVTRDRALAMATLLLDEHVRWAGARVITTRESPAWPRSGTYDRGGQLIDSTALPTCVVQATAEFALRLIEEDRVRKSEDVAVGVSSGGKSKSYGPAHTYPVIPASVFSKIEHLTLPSRLVLVA